MPRLKEYDYKTPGSYFVTICTYERLRIFGSIRGGQMQLNREGKIIWENWRNLLKHYACQLDEFIVMPNHVHAIIKIPDVRFNDKPLNNVAAGLRPAATLKSASVSEIIRAFKSFSAREINKKNGTSGNPVWQRGFYDHIIRTEKDLYKIKEYIQLNPQNWLKDRNKSVK